MKKSAKRSAAPAADTLTVALTLTHQQRKKTYIGTQQDLYDYAELGWNLYLGHQPAFSTVSAAFTQELGDAQLALIAEAKAMPAEAARYSVPEEVRLALERDHEAVIKLFKQGRWYIEQTWKDPEILKIKLSAAGESYFAKAAKGNWQQTRTLITEFQKFLTSNGSNMEANNNMPANFPGEFKLAADVFTASWNKFKQERQKAKEGTTDKSNINEQIYDAFRRMCVVGSTFLFADEPLLQAQFVINNLYKVVRAKHPSGMTGKIEVFGTLKPKPIAKAVIALLDGSGRFAESDLKGRYALKAASGTYSVEIMAEGFETLKLENQKVEIGKMKRLNVQLMPIPVAGLSTNGTTILTGDQLAMAERLDKAVADLQKQGAKMEVLETV